MTATAVLYRSDGRMEHVAPADGTAFTLKEMQGYVGGYIQMIDLPDGQMIVLNEEGKLHDLPFNEQATRIADLAFGDFIVGDVLVGTAQAFGEEPHAPFTIDEFDKLVADADFVIGLGIDGVSLGAQEPPQDPMIYNRRQPDGTFRSLDGFFDPARVRHAEDDPGYDADCPACLRGRPHTDAEHTDKVRRSRQPGLDDGEYLDF